VALTAWNRELGTTQGRSRPALFTPPEGSFAFVLGRDLPGFFQKFNVGDFAEVKQTADFGDAKLVRFRGRIRPPQSLPGGIGWKASIHIDGGERVSTLLVPGGVRDRVDLAANVSSLSGNHELAFRLSVVAV